MFRRFIAHRTKAAQAGNGSVPARPVNAKRVPREALDSAADTQAEPAPPTSKKADVAKPKEVGGPSGPEPTRYGDWERKGICVDF